MFMMTTGQCRSKWTGWESSGRMCSPSMTSYSPIMSSNLIEYSFPIGTTENFEHKL